MLGEIQAEGLRAAGALVERLVHLVDGPLVVDDQDDAPSTTAPLPNSPADAQAATDAWFSMWNELFERTTKAFGAMGPGPAAADGGDRSVWLDGQRPGGPSAVVASVPPGGSTTVEVWLHNGTAVDLGPLVPGCGPLTAGDGSALGAAVAIDPPDRPAPSTVESRAPAHGRRATGGAPRAPTGAPCRWPGAPELWLAIEVVVEAPA